MNYIERNNERGFGQPVIAGTRLTVFSTLNNAYWSESISTYLEEVELNLEQFSSAIEYCKTRRCNKMEYPSDKYCNGCILRSIGEGWHSFKNDFIEDDSISISKDGKTFSLSTIEEMENDEFGVMGWEIAEKLEERLSSKKD